MIDWKNFDKDLIKNFEHYVPDYKSKNDSYILNLVDDIERSKEQYDLKYNMEYFIYNFDIISNDIKQTFLGQGLYEKCVQNSKKDLNGEKSLFCSKYTAYQTLRDFYKREIIEVKDFSDYQTFLDFTHKHYMFIAKEEAGSLGLNISIYHITDHSNIKQIFFNILQKGGCVCEEMIVQSNDLGQFNKSSVNTIRFMSMYDDGNFYKIFAMLRTGRDGSFVDNASRGGVFAEIDVETGIVISDGYTKTRLEHFEHHPDSNVKFKGFKIPKWNELIETIKEMHKKVYPVKLVGWDMALTDQGWVIVEGNGKPNISSMQVVHYKTYGCGLKKEIMSALKKYTV